MKIIRSIKFVFTEEEIAHVRAVWKLLDELNGDDYEELGQQVCEEYNNDDIADGCLFNGLDALLLFMEDHVDLQDN